MVIDDGEKAAATAVLNDGNKPGGEGRAKYEWIYRLRRKGWRRRRRRKRREEEEEGVGGGGGGGGVGRR
ncbi:hypothetical protein TWF694_002778 [Orbilia ellipsospora]|uniref:Uncharacterized protein n=1 Tax=Orbilia ellipsospora TaxID=2528407 RepID=A0AAV9X0H8_9PEZI